MWCTPGRLLPVPLLLLGVACGPAYLEPEAAGHDYLVQGEYGASGSGFAAQVIALGHGAFDLVWMSRGLPGAGWDGESRTVVSGERRGETVHFSGAGLEARWAEGRIRGRGATGLRFDLRRIERTSPTLGAAPPPGAVLLFAATYVVINLSAALLHALLDPRSAS